MSRTLRHTADDRPRIKALICETAFRECCHLMARSPLVIDPVFLPRGLHDIGRQRMLATLQQQVDHVDPAQYSHTLWVYGLCNHGIVGLEATSTPLVVPRAHDCVTLSFGSDERHFDHFSAHPGTYFETTEWDEHNALELDQSLPSRGGPNFLTVASGRRTVAWHEGALVGAA